MFLDGEKVSINDSYGIKSFHGKVGTVKGAVYEKDSNTIIYAVEFNPEDISNLMSPKLWDCNGLTADYRGRFFEPRMLKLTEE